MISVGTLIAAGIAPTQARQFADSLALVCQKFDITTPSRIGAFVAQCMVESSNFVHLEESLYYTTPERIRSIFPSSVHSLQEASQLTRQPEKLANRVYANKLGNGDEASGDGFRFRGRGLLQLTGRNNYTECAHFIDAALLAAPDRVAQPLGAVESAVWFWMQRKLNLLADAGLVDEITRAINGKAMLKADLRRQLTQEAVQAFAQ